MSLIAIASISDGGKNIGFRLLDTETVGVKDIPTNSIMSVLKSGKVIVDNLIVKGNKVVGSNGNLDRLPKIVKGELIGKSPLIIINQIGENEYTITDYNGNISILSNEEVIRHARENGIANGKLSSRDGKEYISPITGEYARVYVYKETLDEADKYEKIQRGIGETREMMSAQLDPLQECTNNEQETVDRGIKEDADESLQCIDEVKLETVGLLSDGIREDDTNNDKCTIDNNKEHKRINHIQNIIRESKEMIQNGAMRIGKRDRDKRKAELLKSRAWESTKYKPITDFIEIWKEKSIQYYDYMFAEYARVKEELEEWDAKWGITDEIDPKRPHRPMGEREWAESQGLDKMDIVILTYGNTNKVKRMLDVNAVERFIEIVLDIEDKAGEIVSCDGLRIKGRFGLDGLVRGRKKKVNILTTIAGGEGNKRFHYRVEAYQQ